MAPGWRARRGRGRGSGRAPINGSDTGTPWRRLAAATVMLLAWLLGPRCLGAVVVHGIRVGVRVGRSVVLHVRRGILRERLAVLAGAGAFPTRVHVTENLGHDGQVAVPRHDERPGLGTLVHEPEAVTDDLRGRLGDVGRSEALEKDVGDGG